MLKKMRMRVIFSTILAFFTVILIIAVLVNVINYEIVTKEADDTLNEVIVRETQANIPIGIPGGFIGGIGNEPQPNPIFGLPNPESKYMIRFFSVMYDKSGNVLYLSTDNIASVDENQAVEFGNKILSGRKDKGYLQEYRYLKMDVDNGTIVLFLNVVQQQQYLRMLAFVTVIVSVVSLLIVSLLSVLFSRRAIKPIAQNIECQKQFITDASHELKTPITSIMTSLDVITMINGEDEWTENIRIQSERMSKLVGELVVLSRLDEVNPLVNKEEFSVSNVAWELVEVYQTQIKAYEKKLETNIQDDVFLTGDKAAVQKMLSVLLDNAIRYSTGDGDIKINVTKNKNKACIEVSNTCIYDNNFDVNKLFERFYRPDSSRNVNLGGTGIGLAIAKSVVEVHGGKIKATCPEGTRMIIQVVI